MSNLVCVCGAVSRDAMAKHRKHCGKRLRKPNGFFVAEPLILGLIVSLMALYFISELAAWLVSFLQVTDPTAPQAVRLLVWIGIGVVLYKSIAALDNRRTARLEALKSLSET